MQLKNYVDIYEQAGVKVAAMSYDDIEQNALFANEQELNYAMLSDQNARTVRSLGILNTDYEEGHPAYGVPLPGILLVSPDRTVLLKRAVPRYQDRPDFDMLLPAVLAEINGGEVNVTSGN